MVGDVMKGDRIEASESDADDLGYADLVTEVTTPRRDYGGNTD